MHFSKCILLFEKTMYLEGEDETDLSLGLTEQNAMKTCGGS
jgi:hypothetical protein